MTDDRSPAGGDQNTSVMQVLVELSLGVVGELEQGPQFFARSHVPSDAHLRRVDRSGRVLGNGNVHSGDHDAVPVRIEKRYPETIPVRVGGLDGLHTGRYEIRRDLANLVVGTDIEDQ